MRVLGLDVGDRRIGVAISDSLGLTAQPLTVLTRRGLAADVETICALISQHGVERLIMGLPLTMRGEHGIQASKVTVLRDALQQRLTIPIDLVDERLTTVQGERALREAGASRRARRSAIDVVAAQLTLQQFLDRHRSAQP
jgi:putative Holliday junction resolvase